MTDTSVATATVVATENEQAVFQRVRPRLRDEVSPRLQVILADGEQLELPAAAMQALQQVVEELADGKSVAIMALDRDLTLSDGARLLRVSRQYFSRLLDAGVLPSHRKGGQRRVFAGDVLKHQRERREGLARLTLLSEEYGLYDEEEGGAGETGRP